VKLAAALVVVAALVAPARADDGMADGARDTVIATQPLAAITRGLALAAERRVATHWSVVVLGGLRGGALGDYSSTTWEGGGELRWWLRERGAIAIAGPYLAAHASLGRTSLAMSATGAPLGTAWGFEQRVDVGWRFTFRGRVALTPSVGLGAHEDVDGSGRLAASTRPTVALGLELGCMF